MNKIEIADNLSAYIGQKLAGYDGKPIVVSMNLEQAIIAQRALAYYAIKWKKVDYAKSEKENKAESDPNSFISERH